MSRDPNANSRTGQEWIVTKGVLSAAEQFCLRRFGILFPGLPIRPLLLYPPPALPVLFVLYPLVASSSHFTTFRPPKVQSSKCPTLNDIPEHILECSTIFFPIFLTCIYILCRSGSNSSRLWRFADLRKDLPNESHQPALPHREDFQLVQHR